MSNRTFSAEQIAARDSIKNSVVSAGAGSGKTTVLAQRYLKLITDHHLKVSEILTLTFTKKATVEMSSRIYSVLKEQSPENAQEFYTASIMTLDSYCNSIAKQGTFLFGISPDYAVDEAMVKEKITSMALPFLLEHRDNQALKDLIRTSTFDEVAEELFVNPMIKFSTIASPLDFENKLHQQCIHLTNQWNVLSCQALGKLQAYIEALDDFPGSHSSKTFSEIYINANSVEATDWPEISVEDIEGGNFSAMEKFTSEMSLATRKKPGQLKNEHINDIFAELDNSVDCLKQIVNFASGLPTVKGIILLFAEFQKQVNDFKRTAGILTYKDIQDIARYVLLNNKEIRQNEKSKYKAIMIDEFQDNNSDQRDILFLLAEKPEIYTEGIPEAKDLCEEKLFFVGDEKQSIYRFRGADVSVFRSLSETFADGNLQMNTNYRSDAALVGAFNTIFGGETYPPEIADGKILESYDEKLPSVFKPYKHQSGIKLFEAGYNSVQYSPDVLEEVLKDKDAAFQQKTHIHLFRSEADALKLLANDETVDPMECYFDEEAEAEWVAVKIRELIDEGANPGEIAILFRNYSLQNLYERALLRHGVNCNAEVMVDIFTDGPINDFYAFLKICVYPYDSLSYTKVLCSPFVNLTQEEAFAVLAIRQKNQGAFEEDVKDVFPKEAACRFERAAEFYNRILETSKVQPITRTISELWYESGYRFETQWNEKVEMYATLYDRLFELSRLADLESSDLSHYVDMLAAYTDPSTKLENMDIPLEKKNAVHMLTIFKSKGLEYENVFIAGTHKQSVRDKSDNPVFITKDFGLVINTKAKDIFPEANNYFYERGKNQNKLEKMEELKRITYVALTRAKKRIFISAKESQRTNLQTETPESIIQVLGAAILHYSEHPENSPFTIEHHTYMPRSQENAELRPNTPLEKTKSQAILNQTYANLEEANILVKEEVKSKYALPSQLHPADDDSKEFSAREKSNLDSKAPYQEVNGVIKSNPKFDFKNFGTIAHLYMECAINRQEVVISNRDIVGLGETESGTKKLEVIKDACERMKNAFMQTETGKAAFASEWHKAEYEFRLKLSGKILKGSIDLLFKNSDGTYTVLDYKTNQSIHPEYYHAQLAAYAEAVHQMTGCKKEDIRCILHYLRFGQDVDVTEECNKVDLAAIIDPLADPEEEMQAEK